MVQAQTPAQKPELKPEEPFQMRVSTELVRVDVTVTDSRGDFIGDLRRENFRIFDEGVEQPITHFVSTEAPAQVLVVTETSPAVYLIHQQHLEGAYALLDGLAADDWVALATYDQAPRLVLNFTQDKPALYRALLALHYNLGMAQLNLFDSLATALDWLFPIPGRKAVVLLTTGLDTSALGRWDGLVEKLRTSDVVVFPIALGGELRTFKKNKKKSPTLEDDTGLSFEQANLVLETMAQITGGRAYFPARASDFATIYRQMATALRHQYTLGFVPPGGDAQFHKIEVHLLDARGRALAPATGKSSYRIHARPGYLPLAP